MSLDVCPRMALAGAFFFMFASVAAASPQVVGDEACGVYDVDMESFASCVDGKVVVPEQADGAPLDASMAPRYAGWWAAAQWPPAGSVLTLVVLPAGYERMPFARLDCAPVAALPYAAAPDLFVAARTYSP